MARYDRDRAVRRPQSEGAERWYGGEFVERPWYAKGIERAERPHPGLGAPRGGAAGPCRGAHRRRGGREAAYPPGRGEGYEGWGAGLYGPEYGEYGRRYRGAGGARGERTWTWRRRQTVPASEVPRGSRRRERWWHAIGPERREDYDWAYGGDRPERYGWTGETGRDGGPGGRRRRRRGRRR